MGQKVSQGKQTISPDVDVFLMRYYNSLQFFKLYNNGMMIKSALVLNDKDNTPLIIKIYFKTELLDAADKEWYTTQWKQIREICSSIQYNTVYNIAPIVKVIELDKAVILIRQYYSYNWKERIYIMPYLTEMEKNWLTFQLLFAVNELHSRGKKHGDIKWENLLWTSNLSLFLSDIAVYKPAYIQLDDWTSYTCYFGGNSDNTKSCNLAPERFIEKKDIQALNNKELFDTTFEMDVFSTGAIIAELFLEENLFDYAKLINFKKGNFDLTPLLNKIKNERIREMVGKMWSVNPGERLSIKECLQFFADEVCPITVKNMLIHFNTLINVTSYWKPDMMIGAIYKHWEQIWKLIFGLNNKDSIPKWYQKLNYSIVNKLILKPSFTLFLQKEPVKTMENDKDNKKVVNEEDAPNADVKKPEVSLGNWMLKQFPFIFSTEELSKWNNETELAKHPELFEDKGNEECKLIFINYILHSMVSTKYESTNIVAMEMLMHFSQKVSDWTKMQLITPYFITMIRRTNNWTRLTSLHYLIKMWYSINYKELILPSSDYNFFDRYIFPSIWNWYYSGESALILEFTNIIDKIIDWEEKFLNVTLKSKIRQYNETLALNPEKANKKDRRNEMFQAYDTQLQMFKSSLFEVIHEMIGKSEEIDIMQTLIRKWPDLLVFYGRRETDEFSKFIISNINRKEWIIQRENVKFIPMMMGALEDEWNSYITLCMESLISNNSNELKIYELIRAVHKWLKIEYWTSIKGVDFYWKWIHFLVHPNLWIRQEWIEFTNTILKLLSVEDTYAFLHEPMTKYLDTDIFTLTPELLTHALKDRLSRVIYDWEMNNFDYKFNKTVREEAVFNSWDEFINAVKMNQLVYEYSDDYSCNNDFNSQLSKFNSIKEGNTLFDPLNREYAKFFKRNGVEGDEAVEKSFFGKVVWFSDSLSEYSLPQRLSYEDLAMKDNNLISQEQFKLKYIVKTLEISIKLHSLNDWFEGKDTNIINKDSKSNTKTSYYINDNYYNKNFANWRPWGKIITTLYEHKNSVEKLLSLGSNKFASFDCEGNAIIWEVTDYSNKYKSQFIKEGNHYINEDINISKEWSYIPERKLPISYSQSICLLDNMNFIIGSKNCLYKYSPQAISGSSSATVKLYADKDIDNDICCAVSFGMNSQESQKIAFCTKNGVQNIYDQRMANVSRSYNYPIECGMISSMATANNDYNWYVGTLGGYIMNYDFRWNSVVESYHYSSHAPIIGINEYNPNKSKEYDLYSMNWNPTFNKYLMIWTGAQDHEIGIWNTMTLNWDTLFKVNTMYGNEIKPLTIELPYIRKENIKKSLSELQSTDNLTRNFLNLTNYTYKFNTNFIKGWLLNNVDNIFYSNAKVRLNKIMKIFETKSTVQKVCSPYKNYTRENCSYILTGGNDSTLRFWDFSKTGIDDKKSYVINAPNTLTSSVFTKSVFDNTIIMQSNECFNPKMPKKDMPGLSEYQNYNGISFHSIAQNEFDDSNDILKYSTRIADAAHKNIITDILPFSLDGSSFSNAYNNGNYLISSSWDGTIKIWK